MARYIQSYTYWNNEHTKLFQEGVYVVWDDNQDTETDIETEAKINNLFASFKDEASRKIETKATELIKDTLKELDYNSEGEVALYATNPASQWYSEASALQAWIEATYAKMYEYQEFDINNIPDIDTLTFDKFTGE